MGTDSTTVVKGKIFFRWYNDNYDKLILDTGQVMIGECSYHLR